MAKAVYSADTKKAKGDPILAVIYARYSSHSQTEQSIEGQLAAGHRYAENKGYTVIKEYCDRAATGRNDNREAFQRMLSDTSKRQFDVIITWKIDRIGRSREDIAFNKHRCKQNGIRIEYVAENLPDSAEAIILESVLEGMAEYYSLQLSENVKRGQMESAKKLQCVGGPTPLGYAVDPQTKRYIVNEKTAPIVQAIFRKYADGATEAELINWLNGQGYRTTQKRPFTKSSLAVLLHSEKYIGVYQYGSFRVEGGMPQLIDNKTFKKVQELMKTNRRAPSHAWNRYGYLLTEKLFCGNCGSPMVGISGTSKTGAKYNYYTCTGHRKKNGCKKKSVRQDWIEEKVINYTITLFSNPETLEYIATKTFEYYQSTHVENPEQAALESQLDDVNRSIQNLVKAVEAGMTSSAFTERIVELETQKNDLTAALAEYKQANNFQLTKEIILIFLQQFMNKDMSSRAMKRKLIQTFINAVYLYDDKLRIVYNYSGENSAITFDTANELNSNSEFVSSASCPTKQAHRADGPVF